MSEFAFRRVRDYHRVVHRAVTMTMEWYRVHATCGWTGWSRWSGAIRRLSAVVMIAGAVGLSACGGGASSNPAATQVAAADVPAEHADGKRLFDTHCARCHGVHAAGTGRGPSFLSKIYEPSHHGDQAFLLAVSRGVTAHHWGFGNMPPVPGVSDEDVTKIVGYVRWAQRVAGIL